MQMKSVKAAWIAVDWGTSRLRAYAMDAASAVAARAASDDGMSALARHEFEPALLALIEPWLGAEPTTIVASGMVGARQGWREAPYLAAPTPPLDAARFVRADARDPRLRVHIAPGVSQAAPPDVMRGEEVQIAGFLAADPDFDGVLCLPGTHAKWARISAGEIVGFKTFMTGELFALLAERSVLRHSIDDGWSEPEFARAVEDALTSPEALTARLFALRAEDLLSGLAPGAARARLSGLLIGTELAAAKGWWLGRRVAIVGDGGPAQSYRAALAAEGVDAPLTGAEDATLAGLSAARAMLEGKE